MGWTVAAILYALPILSGLRYFDEEVESWKEDMRLSHDTWFPELAPCVAFCAFIFWPIGALFCVFGPRE